jgi:glycosyltransferase 2 family protein
MSMTEQPARSPSTRRWQNGLRLVATLAALGIVLFFLGRVLYTNWAQVRQYEWHVGLPWLIVSFVALIASYLVDIAVWRQAITRMGEHIPFAHAIRLWFAAGLAKYIPGTVWQFVGWFYLAQREGVSTIAAGTSIVLTQALSALAGVLLAAGAFMAGGASGDLIRELLLLFAVLGLGVIVLQPRIVFGLLNWGLARVGRQPIDINLSFRDLASIFIFYLLSYSLWGLALFLFTNSMAPVAWSRFPPFLGVFPAAYALGLVAPFAPAGLGVREGVLTYLLSFFMPLPIATVIALLARPWMMAVEITGAGLALASYALQGRKQKSDGRAPS